MKDDGQVEEEDSRKHTHLVKIATQLLRDSIGSDRCSSPPLGQRDAIEREGWRISRGSETRRRAWKMRGWRAMTRVIKRTDRKIRTETENRMNSDREEKRADKGRQEREHQYITDAEEKKRTSGPG